MTNIYDLTRDELISWLEERKIKSFKAIQIYEWLYIHRVKSFEEMTNLKKELIEELKANFTIEELSVVVKQESQTALKYLFKLSDDNSIEAVVMKHDYGISVCVSSQIGCNMGCAFCESGRLKKIRDLLPGEIVGQLMKIEEDAKIKINSVVIMGIGEPFDNYDNIIRFLKIINDPKGMAIGARHITVSTSGLVPKIREFAEFPLQINLALSLHAPNDLLRNKIMKINKVYNIDTLIDAIQYYIAKTNRRVTIEYVMLNGINDSKECAYELVKLLKGMNVYVNLIPYNETSHLEFKKSSQKRKDEFFEILNKNGITVTVRREFGCAIDAACGQLRALGGAHKE
ncbi:MAG: 23S rRNA (adenine(2503)-C(2))-methyltransferase RlmN [Bacilli bacterium]|nr:23S rRNA (adenine(2503)-C(2))-methyltransferase RlmN [Bacilli bacterium]